MDGGEKLVKQRWCCSACRAPALGPLPVFAAHLSHAVILMKLGMCPFIRSLTAALLPFLSAGRLLQHMDETAGFDATNVQILVLDEADRILDMGFSATVDAILENLPREGRQTMLFSATQTKSVKVRTFQVDVTIWG
eukprot:1156865-Pelagomonas_calceolata.AAC.4